MRILTHLVIISYLVSFALSRPSQWEFCTSMQTPIKVSIFSLCLPNNTSSVTNFKNSGFFWLRTLFLQVNYFNGFQKEIKSIEIFFFFWSIFFHVDNTSTFKKEEKKCSFCPVAFIIIFLCFCCFPPYNYLQNKCSNTFLLHRINENIM